MTNENVDKEMEKVIEETRGALGVTEKVDGAWHNLCYAILQTVKRDKFKGKNASIEQLIEETKVAIYKRFLTNDEDMKVKKRNPDRMQQDVDGKE